MGEVPGNAAGGKDPSSVAQTSGPAQGSSHLDPSKDPPAYGGRFLIVSICVVSDKTTSVKTLNVKNFKIIKL